MYFHNLFTGILYKENIPLSEKGCFVKDYTVLVVEADPDLQVLLKDYLELQNMTVWVASSYTAALSLLEPLRPDLILSEIELLRGSGYALIQQWRTCESARGWAPIPAIAISAFAWFEHEPLAKAAGFQVYLEKPFDLEQLWAQITRLLPGVVTRLEPLPPLQTQKLSHQGGITTRAGNPTRQRPSPGLNAYTDGASLGMPIRYGL